MNKKIIFILAALLFAPVLRAQKNIVDEVVWVVGDDPILLSDVEGFRISAELNNEPIENPYCVIPEMLAVQKLFLHQADLDSVDVDESLVLRATEEELNMYLQNYGSRENMETMIRKSTAQIREQIKTRQRDSWRVEQVQQKLKENIKVTPAEVREYFKGMPEDSLPFIPTQVEVQIITSVPESSRAEIERVEEQLREYARRVNSGEADFATLAKLYSQDGSARFGGELGYTGKNKWVPEFANVAFSLNDPKKVSKIVRTEYGFHIIQLIGKQGDKVNVRHILLKPEIDEEEYVKGLARLDSIAQDIRDEKFTFENGVAVLSEDKDTRNNRGLMAYLNPETREVTSRFQMKQLPQDVAKVVDTLKVGEISQAFRMTNEKGQTVCAIVKLKNRIEGHRASMTEDFQKLKDVVFARRSEEKIEKWIREKQKNTYVRINADWRNCKFKYPGWIK